MNKYFTRGLLAPFVIGIFLTFGAFINITTVSAQNITCDNLDSILISLGVTAPDKIAAARVSFGCSTDIITVISTSTLQTAPVATITGSPILRLVTDSSGKVLLKANFTAQITATNGDLNIPINPFTVGYINTVNNNGVSVQSSRTVSFPGPGADKITIDGVNYYSIPEGNTVNFEISNTTEVNQMFAGSYFARLYGSWLSNWGMSMLINPAENATNILTIVGEKGPYLTQANFIPNIISGFNGVKVVGVRINSNQKAVVNCNNSGSIENKLIFTSPFTNGTYASIAFTSNIQSGDACSIYLVDSTNGASNGLGFSVPVSDVIFTPGCPLNLTRNLTVGSSGADVTALQNFLNKNGFNAGIATGYFGAVTKAAVLAFQQAKGISPANGYVGLDTREFINKIDICVPPVTPPTTNKPPVINGLKAPTTLKVGETGTWSVKASDPENGSLNYSIKWGDEPKYITAVSTNATPITQTSTFTHSYSTAGNYKVVITVQDNAGLTAQTSATVQVNVIPTPVSTTTINGACGSVNGMTINRTPTYNLCKTGQASPVSPSTDLRSWNWECLGMNGGLNAICSAKNANKVSILTEDSSTATVLVGWETFLNLFRALR